MQEQAAKKERKKEALKRRAALSFRVFCWLVLILCYLGKKIHKLGFLNHNEVSFVLVPLIFLSLIAVWFLRLAITGWRNVKLLED